MNTWIAASAVGLASWLLTWYLLTLLEQLIKIYSLLIVFTGIYTAITSTFWFYYFNVLPCFPFFMLLFFYTCQLWRLDSNAMITKIALCLVAVTVLLDVFAGWFFGML